MIFFCCPPPPFLWCMPKQSQHFPGCMFTTWHTISLKKTGRSIPITNLPGHYLGHSKHGGKASWWQAAQNSHSTSSMVRIKESHQAWDLISSWLTAACNQGGKIREDFLISNVFESSKTQSYVHYYTNLTKDFRSDLQWWHVFINDWNSISFLESIHSRTTADYYIATDTSGSRGCGGCF